MYGKLKLVSLRIFGGHLSDSTPRRMCEAATLAKWLGSLIRNHTLLRSGRTILLTSNRYSLVGPLYTKHFQWSSYILLIMNTAIPFPETDCLRSCTSKAVSQALLKFFTRFGLPLRERSDHSLLLGVKHYDVYLSSSSFPIKVFTDHNPLTFVHRMKTENRRLLRWSLTFQEYNLDVHHVKDSDNIIADVLFRA